MAISGDGARIVSGSNDRTVKIWEAASGAEVRELLSRNVKRFRGGLVFEAHRLLYHSTLGWRAIKRERERESARVLSTQGCTGSTRWSWKVSLGQNFDRNVTRFEPHTALNLIA